MTGEPVDYLHIFFDIGSGDPERPSHIAFFDVVDHPGDDPAGTCIFAMRVADHAALDAWECTAEGAALVLVDTLRRPRMTSG